MTTELTQNETDFVKWMDALNLEEVNLLDQPAESRDDYDSGAPDEKTEERVELPPQKSLGWDVQ